MPSNIPSKSDKNGAAEFIKHQKLCDLDYYSRFSREELETKHADILHLYEVLKKDTRVWIALSFALIPVSALILWDFYLLFHQSRLWLLRIKKYEHRRDHNSSHTYRSPSAARSIHRIFRF